MTVCLDERILAEYREVLARPRLKLHPGRVAEVLAKLETDGIHITAAKQKWNLPDADDEVFLAVCFTAAAQHLVTGNIRDYPPAQRQGCSVVTPSEFMELWRQAAR